MVHIHEQLGTELRVNVFGMCVHISMLKKSVTLSSPLNLGRNHPIANCINNFHDPSFHSQHFATWFL